MHRTLTGDIELHDIICTQQKQQGEVNESQKLSDFDHTFIAIRKLAPDTFQEPPQKTISSGMG